MRQKRASVTYKRKWFNPLHFIIETLINQGVREFYIYGGKGSAKTFTIAQNIIMRCYEEMQKAIVLRKESATIRHTIKPSYDAALDSVRLNWRYTVLQMKLKGCYERFDIEFKGLDKHDKAKGLEGYADIHLDELDQFTYDDYREMVMAHRGEVAKVRFFSWNPVDINSWIKTQVIDQEEWVDSFLKLPSEHSFVKVNTGGDKALIKTVYQDNYWIVGSPDYEKETGYGFRDQDTIDRYERMKDIDPQWYDVNVLGNWGVMKPDDPFFTRIEERHFGQTEINDNLPVALSFDFNVRNSVIVGQFSIYDKYIRINREYHLQGVDLIELVTEVIHEFGTDRHYLITGDASGENRSALTRGNVGAYDIIKKVFKSFDVRFDMYVPTHNLSHINSRQMCNMVMLMEKDFVIDESCEILRADLERMRATKDGGLDKKHADGNNYGHIGDAYRYFIHNFLDDFYNEYDIASLYDEK